MDTFGLYFVLVCLAFIVSSFHCLYSLNGSLELRTPAASISRSITRKCAHNTSILRNRLDVRLRQRLVLASVRLLLSSPLSSPHHDARRKLSLPRYTSAAFLPPQRVFRGFTPPTLCFWSSLLVPSMNLFFIRSVNVLQGICFCTPLNFFPTLLYPSVMFHLTLDQKDSTCNPYSSSCAVQRLTWTKRAFLRDSAVFHLAAVFDHHSALSQRRNWLHFIKNL